MPSANIQWTDARLPEFAEGAATVGNFDGVHRGHRALVDMAAAWAKRVGGPAVAVTFDPPPYQVLFPTAPPRPPLTTLPERIELLEAAGADWVLVLRTTADLLALSPEAFFQEVLIRQLGAKAVIEGYNFRFGCNRVGNTGTLRSLCSGEEIRFEEVPPFLHEGDPVSSSRVRTALMTGDVARAAAMLGRHYRVCGTVVAGAKRGSTLGFPTANLGAIPTVLPGHGVYAGRAKLEDGTAWPAAINIGPNPTFGESAAKVEVHLIGFTGDLYGRPLAVEFLRRIRDVRAFAGKDDLIAQLKRDVEEAKRSVP
ncbi:MAG TPA: bifunctional riboflavin kinase/FAD synthetase [Urbifossiella sp.]|nr:bifunctional riboflavin kinase/FAD synthetase [Urbifossiella sp.]